MFHKLPSFFKILQAFNLYSYLTFSEVLRLSYFLNSNFFSRLPFWLFPNLIFFLQHFMNSKLFSWGRIYSESLKSCQMVGGPNYFRLPGHSTSLILHPSDRVSRTQFFLALAVPVLYFQIFSGFLSPCFGWWISSAAHLMWCNTM
jgi:hypothetical protein